MTLQEQFYTVEQFDEFVELPENYDKLFEFIGGEIVEVPSNPYVSAIGANIIFAIKLHLKTSGQKGYVTGEAGGYQVAGERYAPDVAYTAAGGSSLAKSGYNPNPPDLAVEVVSSDRLDELDQLRIKITNYLSVGTAVWVVKPEDRRIEVHTVGQAVKVFRDKDTLDAGDVLPGFSVPLAEIFEIEV